MSDELKLATQPMHGVDQTPSYTQAFVHEADDYTFETEVLQRSRQVPVLVDCWAEWCEPCKSLGPTLERLASHYRGRFELVKIDIDKAQRVAMALQVQSVPFMLLFIDGRPVDAMAGNQSESDLRAFLDRHLPPDEGDLYEAGLTALQVGDYDVALSSLQQAMIADPERVEIRLAMARATLAVGDLAAAGQLLDTIPQDHPLMSTAHTLRGLFSLAEFQTDEGSLSTKLESNPQDVDAWYRLGATMALQGDLEHACTAFLKVVALDRGYLDDAGRKALLLIFEVLGGEGDVVSKARRALASYLF
jgi:putative thioredoxin